MAAKPEYDFDLNDKPIIFVFGGPGSGKGTQCEKIAKHYQYAHLSSGDLLRDELKSGSDLSNEIKVLMEQGKLVPLDIVLKMIHNRMMQLKDETKGYLIDGYPRDTHQAEEFEKAIGVPDLLIYYEVSDKTMTERLLNRALMSGRADDNEETIKKRLVVFHEQTVPVLQYYEPKKKVAMIAAEDTIDNIFTKTKAAIDVLADKLY
ncbi:hypothetical protein GJ496_007314 [Pomphorhynchus laevis]|nr:hypothetical protein GJ496_007314 [Pomphorhynchus laevis]